MSLCRRGRRFDDRAIIGSLQFCNDSDFDNEQNSYSQHPFSSELAKKHWYDHVDCTILILISYYRQQIISNYILYRLIDAIEGYVYAYEEDMINEKRLCEKVNEVLREYFDLEPSQTNFIYTYEGEN